MAVHYLDDGNDAGTVLGQSATSLVGFYGATPVDQPANVVDATDAATAITKLNLVIAALEELGILASA